MDERAAIILQEAYETIERVEREQAERAPEREQRALNELLSDTPVVRRRAAPRERVIYKTTKQPEPEPQVQMNAENAKAWEQWADARTRTLVEQKLGEFAEIIGGEVGLVEQRLREELKRLDDTVKELREEIQILRTAKNITPMYLRQRDVA